MELHDLLMSDRHAMALITHRLERGGKTQEYRSVHVWRFEAGKSIVGLRILPRPVSVRRDLERVEFDLARMSEATLSCLEAQVSHAIEAAQCLSDGGVVERGQVFGNSPDFLEEAFFFDVAERRRY